MPVTIEGRQDEFCIVNVCRVIRCIDDQRCEEVEHYTTRDAPLFAERMGEYKSVVGMRIDPALVGEAMIFRTWGWVAIVVSDELKRALEEIGTVGVRFEKV